MHDSDSMHNVERWAFIAAGAAMLAYGLTRRTRGAAVLAAAGMPLVYQGMTSRSSIFAGRGDTREELGGERGIHVKESVRLERTVDEVYRFWRRLDNLPHFMSHLVSVDDLGSGRSHWVATAPVGTEVAWDAEIVEDLENKRISWRSLPGSTVATAGSVTFEPVRGGRSTEVRVHLQYEPPAGRAGALLAWLAGREPSQMIREDLRHMKQLLEAGEVPRAQSPGEATSWMDENPDRLGAEREGTERSHAGARADDRTGPR